MNELIHINSSGEAHMVDVSMKENTLREARAQGFISLSVDTLALIKAGKHHKGDVFATARIAGIQAAKRTWELIPLCHLLLLSHVEVCLDIDEQQGGVRIESCCRLKGKTGVEMEALTAVSVAALTLYDMCKAVDKHSVIRAIRLLEKHGGRSGHFKVE